MSEFLPSPESLTRAAAEQTPVVQPEAGTPLSLSTVQGLEVYLERKLEGMRSELAQNTTDAITTLVPDVLEMSMAQMRPQGEVLRVTRPEPSALVHQPQQQRSSDGLAVMLAGGMLLLAVSAVGGMAWAMTQTPQVRTQQINDQLLQQVNQTQQQLIESNQQIQEAQQRCPRVAIAATCNIGDSK